MVINKELLQLRKKIADKRPEFVRQESWRYDRLAPNWRRPKGKDNKMRKQVSGVPPLAKVGYKGPRKSRGLHPSGYNDILVFNIKDLTKINPKVDAVRIAHTVGNKKRIEIVTEATKLKMKILNPGKIEAMKKVPKKAETKPKKESPSTTAATTETKVEKPKKESPTTESSKTESAAAPTTETKVEKPKKESPAAATTESAAAPTTETKVEKPKKVSKTTGAKSKNTGKKGAKS
ncbi:MAG TPA: 50S ribosomal protein L32e [Nitrososphaeraceae archaeon]|nr:50S ribosomal protein L32e [Nitrososphaeraceae archaeon]